MILLDILMMYLLLITLNLKNKHTMKLRYISGRTACGQSKLMSQRDLFDRLNLFYVSDWWWALTTNAMTLDFLFCGVTFCTFNLRYRHFPVGAALAFFILISKSPLYCCHRVTNIKNFEKKILWNSSDHTLNFINGWCYIDSRICNKWNLPFGLLRWTCQRT